MEGGGHLNAPSPMVSPFANGKIDGVKLIIRDFPSIFPVQFFSSCFLFLGFEASPN